MENLFLKIQRRIAEGMPELLMVDEDCGQLTPEEEDTYPVVFPCCLVDIPQIAWQTLANGYQRGNINVTVKLCIDCYDDTHYTSGTQDKVAGRLAMLGKLHRLLQDYVPEGAYVGLERTLTRFYSLHGMIKVYENTYDYVIEDDGTED